MRRVSEGPLLGESQLREALTHLLNGPAAVAFNRPHFRSPKIPLRATPKNIYLKRSCAPQGMPWRITGPGAQSCRVGNHPIRVPRNGNAPVVRMAQSANYAEQGLLPRSVNQFIREAKSFVFVRSLAEGGEAIR